MQRTLPSIPREHASARPDAPAVVYADAVTTWAQLHAESSRVANALIACGLGPGARVAVLSKSNATFFPILYGTAKAGAVLVAVNWRLAGPEIEYILADARAEVVFASDEFAQVLAGMRQRLPQLRRIVVLESDGSAPDSYERWCDTASDEDPQRDNDSADDVLQLYTSGTTGRPKGALISHDYFFENARLVAELPSRFTRAEPEEATLLTFPLFHIGGINWAFMGQLQGCASIVMRDFDPAAILAILGRWRVPALPMVPAMLQAFLATPGAESTDFSAVRFVVYGAAPMPGALLERAMDVIGCDFVQSYGMTESTIVTVLDAADHQLPPTPRMQSVGRPLPGVDVKIVDAPGRTPGPDDVGQIAIRTPVLMRGYWNLPDETAASTRDGWFLTGDAGSIDTEGYLYLKDRVKDTIISGGENIYPAEVENALYDHPSVDDVAVVGVADDRWGEVPKAFVVLCDGARLEPEALTAHAAERIARYKLPKHFEAIEALPRTASGKVLRRELRER